MSRQSNVELMRVILFIMVVSIHISGPYLNANHLVGTINWQAANFFSGFSRTAVSCFVLISGYFMSQREAPAKQGLKSLLSPLPLYMLPFLYLYIAQGNGFPMSAYLLSKDLLGITRNFYHMWYVLVIAVLYALSGYINRLLGILSKKEYAGLIGVLLVFFYGIPTVNIILGYGLINMADFYSSLGAFITLYCTGGYIRKFVEVPKKPARLFAVFMALNLFIVFLGALYNSRFSPLFFFSFLKDFTLEYPFGAFVAGVYAMCFIGCYAAAVAFFLFMLSLDFRSAAVNYMGKRTYGAYLIHTFWIALFGEYELYFNPYFAGDSAYYPLYCAVFIVLISALSLLTATVFDFILQKIKWR